MLKKRVAAVVMIIMGLIFFAEKIVASEVDEKVGKCIYIVFDNSVSMVLDENGKANTDLADATYALQVLLGMLEDDDTAAIYPISKFDGTEKSKEIDIVTFDSDMVENKKELQNMIIEDVVSSLAEWTYFTSVENALNDLYNKSDNTEKWLVILTDGEYEDEGWTKKNTPTKVDDYLKNSKYGDINIIHYSFGIDSDYNYDMLNSTDNVTYYTDTDDNMLNTMIKIGNQIFGRQEINVKETENGVYSFTLDAPVSKLLFFVQDLQGTAALQIDSSDFTGENSKNLGVGTITEEQMEKIPRNSGQSSLSYKIGTSYQGNIATYEFSVGNSDKSNLLPAGEYEITVQGGDNPNLRLYCEPVIDVGIVFEKVGGEEKYVFFSSDSVNEIPRGEYNVYLELYDPLETSVTENKYETLSSASQFRQQMESAGKIAGENLSAEIVDIWQGKLECGIYQISAEADIFAGLSEKIEIEVHVKDFLEDIKAELIIPDDGINIEKLGEEGNCLKIVISNNGEALSEEYKEAVKIEQANELASSYTYRIEETGDGWLLWPEQKWFDFNDEICGIKEEAFEISLKIGEIEMEPILLKEKIYYHGDPFSINFKKSWGEDIGIIEFLSGNLTIEPLVNGEKIEWKDVEITEISPQIWKGEGGAFGLQLSEDKRKWKLTRNFSILDIITSSEKRISEQEVNINVTLERYEQEESSGKSIEISMNISTAEVIIFIIVSVFLVYLIITWLSKGIRKVHVGRLEGYIEYSKEPVNNMPILIKKCRFYNLFVPGKMKFKVYLNEIDNGQGHFILFKCGAKGVCVIDNLEKCQSFSQIRINGLVAKKNDMYDLEEELRIVVENDPDKTIFLYKK